MKEQTVLSNQGPKQDGGIRVAGQKQEKHVTACVQSWGKSSLRGWMGEFFEP